MQEHLLVSCFLGILNVTVCRNIFLFHVFLGILIVTVCEGTSSCDFVDEKNATRTEQLMRLQLTALECGFA